jgi:4-amino-4-deoxy-L-arabinose transferase-like glycosyltransferase
MYTLSMGSRVQRVALLAAAAIGTSSWLCVALSSRPAGWTYDEYYEGIVWSYNHGGRPPIASSCWVCAHPPLFFLVGLPLYALGRAVLHDPDRALRMLALLSLASAATVLVATERLLRLYRVSRAERLVGLTLAMAFPCLAISAGGPEADVLLAAIMGVFLYRFARYHVRGQRATWREAIVLGALAGLGLLTKYSAAPGLLAAGLVILARMIRGPSRARWLGHGLIVVSMTLAIAGWRYADNFRRYGTLLHGNGGAGIGFDAKAPRSFFGSFDFTSLSVRPVLDLYRPLSGSRPLTEYPVYFQVWTTLHAQAWTDMSFFSVHGRHGGGEFQPYRTKRVWIPLIALTLVAGLVATGFALTGLLATLRRRSLWPITLFGALTLSSYMWWATGQGYWALKTKYLLFLLPAYVLFGALGVRVVRAHLPRPVGITALAAFAVVPLSAETYVWMFALG